MTPADKGMRAGRADNRQARHEVAQAGRFDGAVHDEVNADIGSNRGGERVVRLDLTYTRGTAANETITILTLGAAIALRNLLDGLFDAAGIDDEEDTDDESLGTCTACCRNDCICEE